MAVAIEDAGFQIRDQIMWIYGSGFPKSLDVSKAIDNKAGSKKADRVVAEAGVSGSHENPTKAILNKGTPITPEAQQWKGWGTALKPAHEPIVLARKPLIGTVAANVLEHGTGGLNIDGSRIPHLDEADRASATPQGRVTSNTMAGAVPDVDDIGRKELDRPDTSKGRFPANLIHDGSDEVGELLGEPARFFYCAKASKRDRNEGLDGFELKPGGSNAKGYTADVAKGLDRNRPVANHHPTVKPTDLMRYLVKLITPPSGIVLDPFTGSGSTGKGAVIEGFNFVGIELDPDYVAIATARIQHQLDKLLTDDATRRYLKADDTNDQLF
jgi:site-specific DNA-methyltransferase (adenine-specific)